MNLEKTLPLLFRYKSKNDLAKITKSEKSLGGKVYIFFRNKKYKADSVNICNLIFHWFFLVCMQGNYGPDF